MRVHASEAIALAADADLDELRENRVLALALTHLVEIVGEAANRVPREVQKTHGEIPWIGVIGMRHRLIHGYDVVNLEALWATVAEDLPALVRQLDKALDGKA